MFDCHNLLHPFQNDPGTSQRQRIIDHLLSDSIKIDGRTLADLLDYFLKLSNGINYYDREMNVSDWRPFFANSLPFQLAAISKFDHQSIADKSDLYKLLFTREPSPAGLQLAVHFIYHNAINKIYTWQQTVRGSQLPIENNISELIRSKLSSLLKQFISLVNAAAKWYNIKRIDFSKFLDTPENDWNVNFAELYAVDGSFREAAISRCDRMKILYNHIIEILPSFLEAIKLLVEPSKDNIADSLMLQGNELRQKHTPHLAIVFTFIRLFQKMQDELNKKTKEHLKYFYLDVLRIKPADVEPDKANIIFEVQKIVQTQYQRYRLAKNTPLNGGRDISNTDIIFETDDEIIVTETQVAEVRTLHLNNQRASNETFVQGVYMAPNAKMADGLTEEFRIDPKNWFTLGNRFSKFTLTGKTNPQPYPGARIGFVLASPVLYLGEGKRTVTTTLACEMNMPCMGSGYPAFVPSSILYKRVRSLVRLNFIIITEDLIQSAIEKGIPPVIINKLRTFLPDLPVAGCYSPTPPKKESVIITEARWRIQFFNALPDQNTQDIIAKIFIKRPVFTVSFSGAEDWIQPERVRIRMNPLNPVSGKFTLRITATLKHGQPAVTFFKKEVLGETLDTTLPVIKIELDDELKILRGFDSGSQNCCLERSTGNERRDISFYHFFRGVRINKNLGTEATRINVSVQGIKNFIVQNDENIMDVNNIIFPYGTRPKVDANFYISSKEIFCKNWKQIGVRFKWKDLPDKLEDHYRGYEDFLTGISSADLKKDNYFYNPYFLQSGIWIPYAPTQKKLFDSDPPGVFDPLVTGESYYLLDKGNFASAVYSPAPPSSFRDEAFSNSSRDYYLRLNLGDAKKLAFHHSRYSYILTRQMMALGKWPEIYIGPEYDGIPQPVTPGVVSVVEINDVFNTIFRAYQFATNIQKRTQGVLSAIEAAYATPPAPINFNFSVNDLRNILQDPLPAIIAIFNNLPDPPTLFNPYPPLNVPVAPGAPVLDPFLLSSVIAGLEKNVLKDMHDKLANLKDKRVVIPKEPYTPQIQGMSLDYTAEAEINDMQLFHLYPFLGTNKPEQIELRPSLFPVFCDEGTLFIGLKNLKPGDNLNLLFQMAEATADSEVKQQEIHWHYLANNIWHQLRTGFEVLKDGTNGLTGTGIVKLALPANMTVTNTIMPSKLHWIKASIRSQSRSVSETFAITAQAISATFQLTDANDTSRLGKPLEKESIARLLVSEPIIKTVAQPAESFGARLPELDGSYYLRVSEQLRHKGRAIQKWDYERIVLERFPQVYRAKCINHSFHTDANQYENDIPYAPGYVILALMPDLTKLLAGNSFEPKLPVSLLEKIEQYLKSRTSPFVRLKAANPRYEKVNFCITVRLVLGKNQSYYQEKLKADLRELLAPWAVGKYSKLDFGQIVYRSNILRFLETTDYVDFVRELLMVHENESILPVDQEMVLPVSPRSVLVAGNIDVLIDPPDCDSWCKKPENEAPCDDTELVKDYCKDRNGIII